MIEDRVPELFYKVKRLNQIEQAAVFGVIKGMELSRVLMMQSGMPQKKERRCPPGTAFDGKGKQA